MKRSPQARDQTKERGSEGIDHRNRIAHTGTNTKERKTCKVEDQNEKCKIPTSHRGNTMDVHEHSDRQGQTISIPLKLSHVQSIRTDATSYGRQVGLSVYSCS